MIVKITGIENILSSAFWIEKELLKLFSFLTSSHRMYAGSTAKWQQGSRRYQTSPALCTPITPFPADRPHRLRSEFSGFLFALACNAWHTE